MLFIMDINRLKNNPIELMRLAKAGSRDAFGMIYNLYFTPIYRYIQFRVKNKAEAEDLTHTVFLKAYESIGSFRVQNSAPLAYFFTVARNTVINFWRKKKELIPADPDEFFGKIASAQKGLQHAAEDKETTGAVHDLLQELTDDQQEVIILKFINELANPEIAAITGKNEAAIRQLQFRALKELREGLKKQLS